MPQGISSVSITGFENVIKNLNLEIMVIEGGTRKGLIEVAKFIRRDMEITQPYIPVDTGELARNYHWEPAYDKAGNKGLTFGFYQNYALWVHEMYGAVNWKKAGSGPGFFQAALNRNHDTILQIVAANTKIL